jgi:DNA repair exonuclease SbcCD ATPase subunit
MITRLSLKNFKQHIEEEVLFADGLTAITGPNGSGKSNILKAVLFLLFGASAAGAKDHLRTWGGGQMEVEGDFVLPSVGKVTIRRTVSTASVESEGKVHARGHTPVTAWVEAQLGMSAKLFKVLSVSTQGKSQELLLMGATGLQKLLEEVRDIKTLDAVLTKTSGRLTAIEGMLEGIGPVPDIEGMKGSLAEQEGQVYTLRGELNLLQEGVTPLRQKVAELSARVQEKALAAQKMEALSSILLQEEKASRGVHASLADAEAKKGAPVQDLQVALEKAEAKWNEARLAIQQGREREKLEGTLKGKVAQVQELEVQEGLSERLASEISRLSREEEEARARRQAASEEVVRAGTAFILARDRRASASCPTCNRPFANMDPEEAARKEQEASSALDAARAVASDEGAALEAKSVELAKVRADYSPVPAGFLQRLRKEADDIHAEMVGLPLLTQQMEWDYAGIESNVQRLTRKLREAQELLSHVESLQGEASRAEERCAQASQQLLKAQAAHGSLPSMEALTEQQREAEGALRVLSEQIAEESGTLRVINAAVEEGKRALAAAVHKKEQVATLDQEKGGIQGLVKYLRDNRTALSAGSMEGILAHASSLFTQLTNGDFTNLSRTEEGEFVVGTNGFSAPAEELSGAQRSCLNLCLRRALRASLVGAGGLTLLDEVTADCSEDLAANVADMLADEGGQVLMVTHRDMDASRATEVIALG